MVIEQIEILGTCALDAGGVLVGRIPGCPEIALMEGEAAPLLAWAQRDRPYQMTLVHEGLWLYRGRIVFCQPELVAALSLERLSAMVRQRVLREEYGAGDAVKAEPKRPVLSIAWSAPDQR